MITSKQSPQHTSSADLCNDRSNRLRISLRSLAAGLPELRLIAARKAQVMARQHSPSTYSVAPLPLNMAAFELQEDIAKFADMLGHALRLRYGRHMSAEKLLAAASEQATTLLNRQDASSIVAIAHYCRHKMSMQLTPPEDRRLIGSCPSCKRDLWCTDDDIAGIWIVCGCGAALKVRDIQEQHLLMCMLANGDNAQGTAAGISKLLLANGIHIRRQTISQWKNRGLLHPVAYESANPVFRVWDVWKCWTRRREKTKA